MKTLRFTWLLFRRDLRRQRLRLGFLAATLIATAFIGVDAHRELTFLSPLSHLADLLILLTTISIIRTEAPERETCLLGVLPIPWYALALAKAVFIALILVVPVFALHEVIVYRVGMHMTWTDHAAMLIDVATGYCWFLGGAVIASVLFRPLWLILLLLPIAYFIGQFLSSLAGNFWYSPGQMTGNQDMFLVLQCQELVLEWSIALVAVATALIVYGTRQQWIAAFVAILGLFAVLGFTPLWTIDFSSVLRKPEGPVSTDSWKDFKIEPGPASAFTATYWPEEDTTSIYGPFTASGLIAPYFAEPDANGIRAVAKPTTGKVIEFNSKNFKSIVSAQFEPPNLMPSLVGIGQPGSVTDTWSAGNVGVFEFHPKEYPNDDFAGATIQGSMPVNIRKLQVLGTIPFHDGATLVLRRGRIEVRKIGDDGASYDLTCWQLPLTLSGDEIPPWYSAPNTKAIIYQPGTDHYVILAFDKTLDYAPGTDTRITAGGDTFITTEHVHFAPTTWHGQENPVSEVSWLKNAQISFIVTDHVGKLDLPYEVKDVNLSH
jgi:hypothetical protein